MNADGPLIHRDSLSAWTHLVKHGGLELDGRDADFGADLLRQLTSRADSLEEALGETTLDEFLRAFFQVAQPYRMMFESILQFFESAGATRGRQDWCIALEGCEDLDLEHFRTQLASWQTIRGRTAVPALDFDGAWKIRSILSARGADRSPDPSVHSQSVQLPPWLMSWLARYNAGEFPPLPQDRLLAELPKKLHVILPFLCAAVGGPSKSGLSRNQLKTEWAKRGMETRRHDALYLWSLAWIRERLLSWEPAS